MASKLSAAKLKYLKNPSSDKLETMDKATATRCRRVRGVPGWSFRSGAPPSTQPMLGNHQSAKVVHRRRSQQEKNKQRIRPPVEQIAHEGEEKVLGAARYRVVEQQSGREKIEQEEVRAKNH